MIYVGIDPGGNGGLAAMHENGRLVRLASPKSPLEMVNLLKPLGPDMFITYETSNAFAGHASQVLGAQFRNIGIVEGIVAALGVPSLEVLALKWQRMMLAGKPAPVKITKEMKRSLDRKEIERLKRENRKAVKEYAAKIAARLWPDVSFLETARCKVPHDGMVDAALIAEYGRRTHRGVNS